MQSLRNGSSTLAASYVQAKNHQLPSATFATASLVPPDPLAVVSTLSTLASATSCFGLHLLKSLTI